MLALRRVLLVFGLTALFSSSALAQGEPGLLVETGSPDALCPDLTQARAAVSRRLGSLEVSGRRGFRARYTVGHAPEGSPRDFVRLELFNSEGVRELVRDLPMSGESCTTLAEAIALVLERHFRGLSPEEIPALSSAAPNEGTGQEPASPPAKERKTASQPVGLGEVAALAAPSPVARARVDTLGTLLLAELALGPERPPAVGARVLTGVGSSLALTVALLVDVGYERESLSRGGAARARRGELRASLAFRFGHAPWFGHLGPSLSLSVQHGETRDLVDHSEQLRALWAGGAEAGAGVRLSRHFALALTGVALAAVPPISGHFYVSDEEVLRPSAVALRLGLGAGYAF